MTGRELIDALQELGDDQLHRQVIMFDGPNYYSPYKVEILRDKGRWGKLNGKILMD